MATKEELKEKFSTGKKPTGSDFSNLIDESVQDLTGLQEKGDYATTAQLEEKADKNTVEDLVSRVEALEGAE